jgi:hypothetical protein
MENEALEVEIAQRAKAFSAHKALNPGPLPQAREGGRQRIRPEGFCPAWMPCNLLCSVPATRRGGLPLPLAGEGWGEGASSQRSS